MIAEPSIAKETQTNGLTACLGSLLSFYDLHVDLQGLFEELPHESEVLTYKDAAAVLTRLGFESRVEKLDKGRLPKTELPCLILLDSGQYALYMPEQTHGGKVIIPGATEENLPDFDATSYKGEVLLVSYAQAEIGADTTHMKHSHALDWFWDPIKRYWSSYSEVLLCSFFINCLVLALPLFTMNVYDRVIVNFAESTLIVLTVGVLIALTFDFLFKIIRSYILERVAEDVGARYDFALMERLLLLKPSEMNMSIGELANIFRELQSIREFYAGRLAPTFVDVPFLLLFVTIIYLIAPPLAVIPLVGSSAILIVNFAMRVPVNRLTEAHFSSSQGKSALLIETLAGLQTIKMFNAIGSRLLKWDMTIKHSAATSRQNSFMMNFTSSLSLFISQVTHISLVFFGVYEIAKGDLTIGGLIACTIISGRAVAPVIGFANNLARLKQSNDVLKMIDKFFLIPYEDEKAVKKSPKGPFEGRIEVRQVSYSYDAQNRPALKDISLSIAPGERVGLIGKTGAGKSTLAKILGGFIAPAAGTVTLDSYDYGSIPATELRRTIGYVPQDAFFFKGSIRHNIIMGREHISDEAIEEAARVSGLDLVMQQTAQGLDMEVGENGSRLSGGQKQAISLARALIRQPDIIIFDEPTTGMDAALENRVRVELDKYLEKKTFIMVTHRTSLLSLVNRLVLIDSGVILADGPRDEILAKLSS